MDEGSFRASDADREQAVLSLGHVRRSGRLRLRGWTFAASALADLDFDLREAAIDHPQTAVTIRARPALARWPDRGKVTR